MDQQDAIATILGIEDTEANKPLINAFIPEQSGLSAQYRWIEPEREITEQELEKALEGHIKHYREK